MKIFILLITISANLHAYELLNFSSSKVRSESEILLESKLTKDQLQDFSCSNKERFDLFSSKTIVNMAKDSLKVIIPNNKVYTYSHSNFVDTKNRIITPKDSFGKTLLKTLRLYESIPETRQLIEELQFSQYPFYIKKGGNRYSANHPQERPNWQGNNTTMIMNLDDYKPMVTGLPFNQIGFGGLILWNPKSDYSFMEEDWIQRKVDPRIILGHEMFHAYDGMRGLLDRRFVKSHEHEFQPVTEYRAVRMENIIRVALGGKRRKFYSYTQGDTDQKDMLDINGETIKLPTPCIKWIK